VYDATYAIARGLHELINVRNRTTVVGSELHDVMIKIVNFTGVTGFVNFYNGAQIGSGGSMDQFGLGDRLAGNVYNLMAYFADSNTFEPVGHVGMDNRFQLNDARVNQTRVGPYVSYRRQMVYGGGATVPPPDRLPDIIATMIEAERSLLYFLGALGLALSAFIIGMIIAYRHTKLVKASQPVITAAILLGELLGSIRCITSALVPTDGTCSARVWLGHLAYGMVFGALIMKTWYVCDV
jgi:uncharacterized membrane protein YjfL (UPF0719 family)